MEENKNSSEKFDTGAPVSENTNSNEVKKRPFRLWLENFFYHYKWHTAVVAFILIIAIVCSVQMCQREEYDIYVLYAGGHSVSKTAEGGDISEYVSIMSEIKGVSADFDGDGKVNVSLDTLYMLSEEEIDMIEKELEEAGKEGEGYSINYAQLAENNTVFRDRMLYSEYYVCLISSSLFEAYREVDGYQRFVPLTAYLGDESEAELLEGSNNAAVYLKSTSFGKLPAMSKLPDDTVIVLRAMSEVSAHFGNKENRELYRRSEELIKRILND